MTGTFTGPKPRIVIGFPVADSELTGLAVADDGESALVELDPSLELPHAGNASIDKASAMPLAAQAHVFIVVSSPPARQDCRKADYRDCFYDCQGANYDTSSARNSGL
jgi:hypothetical protein